MIASDILAIPLQNNGGGGVALLVYVAVLLVVVGGMWKAFEKAGEPGWAALIPIYNLYVIAKIGGNEWWWLLLLFVPIVNIFATAKLCVDVAKAFEQGLGFGLGLWLLGFVFWPLLGFGEYQYQSPAAASVS